MITDMVVTNQNTNFTFKAKDKCIVYQPAL